MRSHAPIALRVSPDAHSRRRLDDDPVSVAPPPPWKSKVVEPIALRSPRPSARRRSRGRLQHFPASLRRRLRRPAHRQRHVGALAGAARGDGARRRGVCGLAQLLPARGGDARRVRLAAPHSDPPGPRRRAPLSRELVRPGTIVPSNLYFTTSREHVGARRRRAGSTSRSRRRRDPESPFPFKGNIDLGKLETCSCAAGAERVAYVRQEACLNMAGGQPFSLENLRAVRELTRAATACPSILDATRISENALFIKEREPGYEERSLPRDPPADRRSLPTAPSSARRRITSCRSAASSPSTTTTLAQRRREQRRRLRGLPALRRHRRSRHGGARAGDPRVDRRAVVAHYVGQARYLGELLAGRGRADRRARRRARGIRRREALPAASRAARIPRPDARGSLLPRRRRPLDGARNRLGPARRRAVRRARARAADDPAPRLHAGAPDWVAHTRRARARARGASAGPANSRTSPSISASSRPGSSPSPPSRSSASIAPVWRSSA